MQGKVVQGPHHSWEAALVEGAGAAEVVMAA
jgi:hypothetical protein